MPSLTSAFVWAVSGALGIALTAGGAYAALADTSPPGPAQPAVTLIPSAGSTTEPDSSRPNGSLAPRPEATSTHEQVSPASPISAPSPETDD